MSTIEEISNRLKASTAKDVPKGPVIQFPVERSPTKDELIVRQNSLAHADVWFQIQSQRTVVTMEQYFATAERVESWVHRKVSE